MRHTRILRAAALLAAIASAPGAAIADPGEDEFVLGEVLVRFEAGSDGPAASAIRDLGARLLEKLSRIDVSRLALPKGIGVRKAVARLQKLPFVKYAEPNYILRPTGAPDDPRYGSQWALDRIRAPEAWTTERGSRDVVIAIVDTGVDLDHPDLAGKIVSGYDFVDGDGLADDVGGHGTHCAGIAAAATDNGVGVAGVCPGCSIMPMRVLGPDGGSSSDVAKGIVWASDHGANVISASLGGPWPSSVLEDAIGYAWDKGAIIVAAAGNDNTKSPHYPGYLPQCLAVGSTDRDDARADYSNNGDWVDVAAPGDDILSTVPGDYGIKTGTSMSTPHVAGLAGLVWSRMGSGATNARVRKAIEDSSVGVGGWLSGGRVDAAAAVALAGPPSSGGSGTGGGDGGGAPAAEPGEHYREFSPNAFSSLQGWPLESPKNSLVYSDDSRLVYTSTTAGYRRYLDYQVSTRVSWEGTLESLTLKVESAFDSPGEMAIYLYNWKSDEWDWIGQPFIDAKDTSAEIVRASPGPYVSEDGDVKARFYRETSWWNTIVVQADWVRFGVTSRVEAPQQAGSGQGGDQGEPSGSSLGDAAKSAWEKIKKGW